MNITPAVRSPSIRLAPRAARRRACVACRSWAPTRARGRQHAGQRRPRPPAARSRRRPPRFCSRSPAARRRPTPVDVTCNGVHVAVGHRQVLGSTASRCSVLGPRPLPKGECAVAWRVTDTDGQSAGSSALHASPSPTTRSPPSAPDVHDAAGPRRHHRPATTQSRAATPHRRRRRHDGDATESAPAGPLGLFRLLSNLGARRPVRLTRADRDRVAGRRRVHPHRALPALGVAAHAGVHATCSPARWPPARSPARASAVRCRPPLERSDRHHAGHGRAGPAGLRRSPAGWSCAPNASSIRQRSSRRSCSPGLAVVTMAFSRSGVRPPRLRRRHRCTRWRWRCGSAVSILLATSGAGRPRRGGPRARRPRASPRISTPALCGHDRHRLHPDVPARSGCDLRQQPRSGASSSRC